MPVAVDVRSGRHAESQEASEDVVAVLLVGGEKPIFQQERPIGEAIGIARYVALQEGRDPDYDFGILKRDQLDSLAGAEVVDRNTVAHRLEVLVVARFLFEPRGDGHQRSYPVGLLALDLGDTWEPVNEVVLDFGTNIRDALCATRRRDGKNNRNQPHHNGSQRALHHFVLQKLGKFPSDDLRSQFSSTVSRKRI